MTHRMRKNVLCMLAAVGLAVSMMATTVWAVPQDTTTKRPGDKPAPTDTSGQSPDKRKSPAPVPGKDDKDKKDDAKPAESAKDKDKDKSTADKSKTSDKDKIQNAGDNSDKAVALKMKLEEEKYRNRMAKIQRLRDIAKEQGDDKRLAELDKLEAKTQKIHDDKMSDLKAKLPPEESKKVDAHLSKGRVHGKGHGNAPAVPPGLEKKGVTEHPGKGPPDHAINDDRSNDAKGKGKDKDKDDGKPKDEDKDKGKGKDKDKDDDHGKGKDKGNDSGKGNHGGGKP